MWQGRRRRRSSKWLKIEMISRRNINSELSADIIQLIFSKIPLFNLPTCRLVCKAWNNLLLTLKTSISNLFVAHISPYRNLNCVDLDTQHLDGIDIVASFSFLPSRPSTMVKIFNSCNGLLLYCSFLFNYKTMERSDFDDVCILNPMTNEYIKLPNARKNSKVMYYYGFGFSLKTKQYKIVRYSFVQHNSTTLVEIFAFGTGTNRQWTHVGFVPFALHGHGTYFNGALYWVGVHQHRSSTNVIFRFDVEDEKFEEVSFPQKSRGDSSFCFLGVLNGTLYLTFKVWKLFECQIWKMEEDSSSWIKAFVVPNMQDVPMHFDLLDQITESYYRSYHLQLIKVYEDGKILCLYGGFDLILYNPRTGRIQKLTRPDHVQMNKHLLVYQIDGFNFDPLHKILAGDVEC